MVNINRLFLVGCVFASLSFGSAQADEPVSETAPDFPTWYWKITPIEYYTTAEDGTLFTWNSRKSSAYFDSKKDCQQAIALRLKDQPLSNNQIITCENMGPAVPVETIKAWSYNLNVLNASTEDKDGTIRIWHNRIGRAEFDSLEECQRAAQKALTDMASGWNYEAKCRSSFQLHGPVQVIGVEILGLEPSDPEAD